MDVRCPNDQLLKGYVTGGLSRPDHDGVERHVDDCESCRRTVADLDDTLASPWAFGAPSQRADEPDAELSRLVEMVRPLGRSLTGETLIGREEEPPLVAGATFAGYEVGELIARGGMGWVYRGRHVVMKRDVAIKVLPVGPDAVASLRERFAREIEALASLRHPNVVAAHDAGEADGLAYLVMEFVEGRDLDAVVRESGPLEIEEAATAIRQAAEGLRAAHAAGLVHRDVKPANLLRDAEGHVRVSDLGLARATEPAAEGPHGLTKSGMVMGTVGYLAPEQALDPAAAGPPADVYALGCTLFELLTGRRAFDGNTAMEVIVAHREQPIPDPRESRPDCPAWLADLCESMLAKEPSARPTIDDVLSWLEEPTSFPRSAWERTPRRSASAAVPDSRDAERRDVRSHAERGNEGGLFGRRWLPAVAATAAVLLVGVAWSAGWFGGRTSTTPPDGPDTTIADRGKSSHDGHASPVVPDPDPGDVRPNPPNVPAPVFVAMREVPAGTFTMGASAGDERAGRAERPAHEVRLTNGFLVGTHEVTVGQWRDVMGDVPRLQPLVPPETPDSPTEVEANLPVAGVTWHEAVAFCNALSERNGLPAFYRIDGKTVTVLGGTGFRLPTEAEWEYAARAGTETAWSFGDDLERLDEFAWTSRNSDGTPRPVGTRAANPWGLFDVHGNVPEWCWDRFDPEHYRDAAPVNPSGPTTGLERVFRGGSASDAATATRSSARKPLGGHYSGFTNPVGLRLVRNLP